MSKGKKKKSEEIKVVGQPGVGSGAFIHPSGAGTAVCWSIPLGTILVHHHTRSLGGVRRNPGMDLSPLLGRAGAQPVEGLACKAALDGGIMVVGSKPRSLTWNANSPHSRSA